MRALRTRLQDAGKPFKVAIIATARKILTILNAMVKTALITNTREDSCYGSRQVSTRGHIPNTSLTGS
jgi:hypothetical protein